MVKVEKVYANDFERIYPLLCEFEGNPRGKDQWKRLFTRHWDCEEDLCGYALMEGNEIVGFLGLIFSERLIDAKKQKFCNISIWMVRSEFRNKSLNLIYPLIKQNEYVLTNFTGSKDVYAIFKGLGFKDYASHVLIVPPLPYFNPLAPKISLEWDRETIVKELKAEALKVFQDHSHFQCIHLLLRTESGNCYLILKKTKKKRLLFAQIHYISDGGVFGRFIGRDSFTICRKLKVAGLLIDDKFDKISIGPCLRVRWPQPRTYKSDGIPREKIDSLYSELMIFDDES